MSDILICENLFAKFPGSLKNYNIITVINYFQDQNHQNKKDLQGQIKIRPISGYYHKIHEDILVIFRISKTYLLTKYF